MEPMDHGIRAAEYFAQGYSCSQSVVLAFAGEMGMTPRYAARLASSFGGGLARMRSVCGAVSGMAIVLGYFYGYDSPEAGPAKKEHYARVQEQIRKFSDEHGTIICAELLKNLSAGRTTDPTPEARTPQYYARRPCAKFVYSAAHIVEEYMREHPLEDQP